MALIGKSLHRLIRQQAPPDDYAHPRGLSKLIYNMTRAEDRRMTIHDVAVDPIITDEWEVPCLSGVIESAMSALQLDSVEVCDTYWPSPLLAAYTATLYPAAHTSIPLLTPPPVNRLHPRWKGLLGERRSCT